MLSDIILPYTIHTFHSYLVFSNGPYMTQTLVRNKTGQSGNTTIFSGCYQLPEPLKPILIKHPALKRYNKIMSAQIQIVSSYKSYIDYTMTITFKRTVRKCFTISYNKWWIFRRLYWRLSEPTHSKQKANLI